MVSRHLRYRGVVTPFKSLAWWVRHNRVLSVVLAAAVLAVINAAIWTRPWALFALGAAAAGCVLVVALPAYISGASAIRHSAEYRRSIEGAEHQKELPR